MKAVQAYSSHEKTLLEEVTKLRVQSERSVGKSEKTENEKKFTVRILAIIENYPDLKADTSFVQLQQELVEVEDHLQYARRYFNGAVRDYNILVEMFPSNIIAKIFGFENEEFFEVDYITERASPDVGFA